MNISDLKEEKQIGMLKDICKKISELPDDYLEGMAEDLLQALVDVMDEQSCDDAWGTEGWKHNFGYDD